MKIQIFYAKAGNGHLTPAKLIKAKILERNPNSKIELIDGLMGKPFLANALYSSYRFLIKLPWLWAILYYFSEIELISRLQRKVLEINCFNFIEKKVLEARPEKLITTYYFGTILEKIIEKHKLNCKLIVCTTDISTCPRIWFWSQKATYLVFSKQAKQLALDCNIKPNKIYLLPFLVNDKKHLSDQEVSIFKEQNDLNSAEKIILILSGGEGLPKAKDILINLKLQIKNKKSWTYLLICGRDKNLYDFAIIFKQKNGLNNLLVFGFVDFVEKVLKVCDVVISKAGTNGFLEALIAQKPLIICSYLWKQELGNKDFVVNNNFGFYEPSPKKLPEILEKTVTNQLSFNKFNFETTKSNFDSSLMEVILENNNPSR